jgi:hypothetical protein
MELHEYVLASVVKKKVVVASVSSMEAFPMARPAL